MKKLVALLLLLAPSAYADTLYGLYADVNYWHTQNELSQSQLKEVIKSGNYKDGQIMLSASLEHGVPLIPNARIRHTTLNADNSKLSSTDAIAYYELLDNVVSLDVGLGAKRLNGNFDNASADVSKTLPMAYASAGAKLPFTGLSAKAEVGVAHDSKYKATDAQAELKYDFIDKALIDVGVKAGYRLLTIEADDVLHDAKSKVGLNKDTQPKDYKSEFKGPYVGVEVHF